VFGSNKYPAAELKIQPFLFLQNYSEVVPAIYDEVEISGYVTEVSDSVFDGETPSFCTARAKLNGEGIYLL
jgi:hypothetical protein